MKTKRASGDVALEMVQLASLGELSRGIFHDLASPLTAITLVAETLCASAAKNPEAARVCAEELLFSCHDLRGLVVTIREYIADPGAERTFSLREAAEHAARLVRHRARRSEAEILVAVEEPAAVFGKPLPVVQVLVNLLGNAADACAERLASEPDTWRGRISIAASVEGGLAKISVSDNGVGMAPEVAARIFEPHYSTKGRAAGSGLGLDTVRRITEQVLRGKIAFETAPGAGAVFHVEFPVHRAPISG